MKQKEILLIGGGGHCRSVIDVIEQEGRFTIAGIVDQEEALVGKKILGYEIIATEEALQELHKKYQYALIAVGQVRSNEARVRLFAHLKEIGYTLPNIISPLAYCSKHAKIGEGSIVMHQALINANATIGDNCIINTKALIEHDAIIESHTHISTAAAINGGVRVKENSFVGSNATLREGIVVDGFIKAGTVQK